MRYGRAQIRITSDLRAGANARRARERARQVKAISRRIAPELLNAHLFHHGFGNGECHLAAVTTAATCHEQTFTIETEAIEHGHPRSVPDFAPLTPLPASAPNNRLAENHPAWRWRADTHVIIRQSRKRQSPEAPYRPLGARRGPTIGQFRSESSRHARILHLRRTSESRPFETQSPAEPCSG